MGRRSRSDASAREQFDIVYDAWHRGKPDVRLPNGESADDLRPGYLPVVESITSGATGIVVLVSHGASIRLAAGALLGAAVETRYMPNAGLVVLRPATGPWSTGTRPARPPTT